MIMYVSDVAPINIGGGNTLVERILQNYPADRLTGVIPLCCRPDLLQGNGLAGRWFFMPVLRGKRWNWLNNLALAANTAFIPIAALLVCFLVLATRSRVIVGVAHGQLFLSAILAGIITGAPVVLLVHDDWTETVKSNPFLSRFAPRLFHWACSHAAHIYAVGPSMRTHLLNAYGIPSEVQLPSTVENEFSRTKRTDRMVPVRIVFAGNIYHHVLQPIHLLVKLLKAADLELELHFYSDCSREKLRELGWEAPNVVCHGWVSQEETRRGLASADVLFLPCGFDSDSRPLALTSFPSKFADYAAAGRPILVFAPGYSEIASYAREHGCAAVVTEESEEALRSAVHRILEDEAYAEHLRAEALRVFLLNHCIETQRREFADRIRFLARRRTRRHES